MKEFLYKLLDMATLGKGMKRTINGHTVRLPTRYYKYFPDNYEKENFEFLLATVQKGDVVLDIGAHIGLFAAIASQAVGSGGKVFAFEPSPTTYSLLSKTMTINNATGIIKTYQQAVGSQQGKTTFFISNDQADNSNSLVNYKEDRPLHGIDINVTTIDFFVSEQQLSKVDFVKIDVEGAEFDAIKGAVNTFKKFKPVCILAIHPEPIIAKGDTVEDMYDFIQQMNYTILYHNQPISREAFCANKQLIDLHLIPR